MIAVLAVALDDGDLDDVAGKVDCRLVADRGQAEAAMLGDDLARQHADDRGFAIGEGDTKIGSIDRARLDAVEADGSDALRVANSASVTSLPPAKTMPALQLSRLSTTTRSARQPGATSPRSRRPKARAAEIEAAR